MYRLRPPPTPTPPPPRQENKKQNKTTLFQSLTNMFSE